MSDIEDDLDQKEREEQKHFKRPKRWPKEIGERRRRRAREQGFLVDRIWPEGSIHLLAGPSGIGKTTWLLRALYDWTQGKPVLGFPSHPQPYIYIMCDRSGIDLQRTLDRMGLGDWEIEAVSIEDIGHDPYYWEPDKLRIEDLPAIFPEVKVFIIEAYNWFYKDRSSSSTKDYVDTLRFWSRVRDHFSSRNLSMICTTHEAKQNEYVRTRDKVYGSVAQAAVSGTVMSMESDEKNLDVRYIRVAPRDSKEFIAKYIFTPSGTLEYVEMMKEKDECGEDRSAFILFDKKYEMLGMKPGDLLPTSIVKEWMQELNLSRSTAARWLASKVDNTIICSVQKGVYRVMRTPLVQ